MEHGGENIWEIEGGIEGGRDVWRDVWRVGGRDVWRVGGREKEELKGGYMRWTSKAKGCGVEGGAWRS